MVVFSKFKLSYVVPPADSAGPAGIKLLASVVLEPGGKPINDVQLKQQAGMLPLNSGMRRKPPVPLVEFSVPASSPTVAKVKVLVPGSLERQAKNQWIAVGKKPIDCPHSKVHSFRDAEGRHFSLRWTNLASHDVPNRSFNVK